MLNPRTPKTNYEFARDRILAKDPDYYSRIGKKGGSAQHKTPRGFAADRELAKRAGQIGGKVSRKPGKSNASKASVD